MADTKRILIIDDEKDALAFVEAVLSEIQGVVIAKAENGADGMSAAKQAKPDLVCLDVQMPKKNGFEVFRELREDSNLKSVPVIMMTGVGQAVPVHFTAEEVGQILGEAPNAYIEKPLDPGALRKKAEELLGLTTA